MPRPKIEDFLSDPKHEEEKNFFFAAVNAAVDKRIEAAKAAKKAKGGDEEVNFFDSLFGPKE